MRQNEMMRELLSHGEDIESVAQRILDLGTPDMHNLNKLLKDTNKARWHDMAYEVWVNSILSGPHTHMVNMIGNTLVAFRAPTETAAAAAIRLGKGVATVNKADLKQGRLIMGEAAAQAYALASGMQDFLVTFAKVTRTGETAQTGDFATKFDSLKYRKITAANVGMKDNSPFSMAFDLMSDVLVRGPSRMLLAEDEAFKAVARRMELRRTAYRTAADEGLRGRQAAERMAEIISDPSPEQMMKAIDFSRDQTFTKQLGPAGQAGQRFINMWPAAKYVVPFVQTPTNIMKDAFTRTPLGILAPAIRADIKAGGAARDKAIATVASGSLVMLAAYGATANGLMTGSGPQNKNERARMIAQGWRPYSVWLPTGEGEEGGRWLNYQRLDPAGMTMGIAADLREVLELGDLDMDTVVNPEHMDEMRDAWRERGYTEDEIEAAEEKLELAGGVNVGDIIGAVTGAIGNNLVEKSYTSGIARFFEMFSTPTAAYKSKLAQDYIQGLAQGFIPYSSMMRQTERLVDPEIRQAEMWVDMVRQMVPGLTSSMPPKLDLWGEPTEHWAQISPLVTAVPKAIFADQVMASVGVYKSVPGKTVNGVPLDPEEHNQYVALAGNAWKDPESGLGLKDAVEAIGSGEHPDAALQDEWDTGTEGEGGEKAALIDKLFRDYRKGAKAALLDMNPRLALSNEWRRDLKAEARGE